MKCAGWPQCSATFPLETPFSDPNTSLPIMAKTPLAVLASLCLFLSQPHYFTLEFVAAGIMRPQPVNNETKDVAHQLRSTYCLASISSAPLHPPCICVRFHFVAVCAMWNAISLSLCFCCLFIMFKACAQCQKNTQIKRSLKYFRCVVIWYTKGNGIKAERQNVCVFYCANKLAAHSC